MAVKRARELHLTDDSSEITAKKQKVKRNKDDEKDKKDKKGSKDKKDKKDKKAKRLKSDSTDEIDEIITEADKQSREAEGVDPTNPSELQLESLNRAEKAKAKAEKKARKEARKAGKKTESAIERGQTGVSSVGEAVQEATVDKAEKKKPKATTHKSTANDSANLEAQEIIRNKPMKTPGAVRGSDGISGKVQGASKSETEAYFQEQQIAVQDPLKQERGPVLSFDSLPFDAEIQKAYFSGFSKPTPIQAASWPYLFDGRDMIGVAETGSGKTFAFGVPCINNLQKNKKIQVCIVSPTRELALQIQEQMTKLALPQGLKATCVYGGTSKDDQRRQLKGTQILVATPGRLNDFIGDGSIDLSGVSYLVLDEADRMLDKGFEQDIRKIITAASASSDRQTLMFTATWPESVRKLASEFLRTPVRITIGDNASGELRANTRIVQEVEVIEEMEKQNRLFQLLKQYQSGKNKHDRILVFTLYKKEASRLEEFIRRKGFTVAGIHGDLSQQKRIEALEAFKNGEVPLLVATDVAARGLDIPAVKVVINVTFPLTVEDYVHRIGRTGRAGQDGRAITLFTQNEKGLAGALINVLKKADQAVPEELMKFGTTVKKKSHDAYGAFYKDPGDMKAATKITFD